MKLQKKIWFAAPLLIASAYLAVNPRPLYAIFGFGDIVFDPTTYATMGEIWNQDISNYAKMVQTYNETVKIVTNGLQMYALATQMAHRIENKSVWETVAFSIGNEEAQRHYNESVNWSAVMNGDPLNAGRAWQDSTRYAGNAGYLGGVSAANSRRMSEYATIQMLDATSQRCAKILATYKTTQDANLPAESNLKLDALDSTDGKNSMVAVLNIISGGSMNIHTQEKANGNLQACLAEQKTLEAKVQRDKLADEQNWYADIAAARASSPAMLDPNATASTPSSYLIP
jgi:type IV secretion system protein TrbJ